MLKTESDTAMATMCAYPSSNYVLTHWTCVLCWCVKCPRIDLPSIESDQKNPNFIPKICFHAYQLIVRRTAHVRRPFNEKKQCQLCVLLKYSIVNAKLYTI